MANFTVKEIKELMSSTGAGMMDCKNALTESDGDIEKAIVLLREKGRATQAKKANRVSAEGIVKAVVKNGAGAIVEVNSETDFAAKGEAFKAFVDQLADTIIEANPADMDALKAAKISGGDKTVGETFQDLFDKIRENIQIRRFARLDGVVTAYTHFNGNVATLVKLDTDIADTDKVLAIGNDVALQIISMSPQYLTADEIPVEIVDNEKAIARKRYAEEIEEKKEENARLEGEIRISEKEIEKYKDDPKRVAEEENLIKKFQKDIAKNLGFINKPAKVVEENILPGKINAFFKEVALLEQEFVKATEKESVGKYVEKSAKALGGSIKVASFVRFERGEGIEKKVDDFAAEVASLVK